MKSIRWRAAMTPLAFAVLLTGCTQNSAPPDQTDNAADTENEVSITAIHAPVNYEPLYIADREGYFDEVGLDVTINAGGTPQDNLAQIMGGSADLTIISWDVLVTSTAEDMPVRAVASNSVVSDAYDTSGLVVNSERGITEVADLEGLTIAFNDLGGGPHVVTQQAFDEAGLSGDDFEAVRIPFASMQTALESGQVDAAFPSDSFYRQMLEHDDFEVIANPSREFRAGLPLTMWAATEPWLEGNPEVAERFIEAMDRAIDFYEDSSNDEAVAAIREDVTGEAQDDAEEPAAEFSTLIDLEVSQSVTDALVQFDIIENPENAKEADELIWENAPTQ